MWHGDGNCSGGVLLFFAWLRESLVVLLRFFLVLVVWCWWAVAIAEVTARRLVGAQDQPIVESGFDG